MIEIKSFILFFSFLGSLSLAVFALLQNWRSSLNRYFSFIAGAVAFWNFNNGMLLALRNSNEPSLYWFDHFSFASVSILPAAVLIFALTFPRRSHLPGQRHLIRAVAMSSLFFVTLSFTNLITREIRIGEDGSASPIRGPGFVPLFVYGICCLTLAAALLHRKYKRAMDRFERLQTRYLVFSAAASPLVILLGYPFAAPFGGTNITIMFPAVSFFFLAPCAYAIVRYRLMDITVVYRNAIVYTLMVFCLTCILGGMLHLFKLYLEDWFHMQYFSVILFSSTVIATGLPFLKKGLELFVDKKLMGGPFDYQSSLAYFTGKMSTILDLESLQNLIVAEIVGIMKVESCGLFRFDVKTKRMERTLGFRFGGETQGGAILGPEDPLMGRLIDNPEILIRYEVKRTMRHSEFRRFAESFDRFEAEMLIPVRNRNQILGAIALGGKRSGDIFTKEDIALLKTLGNQFAAAWDNAALHQSITVLKNHFENILQNMTGGVIVIDEKRTVTTFNRRAENVLGLRAHAVLGRSADVLPRPFVETFAAILDEDRAFSGQETRLAGRDGGDMIVGYSANSFREEDGSRSAFIIFSDLTRIKKLEDAMRHSERMNAVGVLAAGMAHEIKNPLVSIKTFSELLPTRYDDPEFRDQFAPIVRKEVDRINGIVNRLLNFAKPRPPDFRPQDVHALIEQALRSLSEDFKAKNIRIEKSFSEDRPDLYADADQMRQVFLNLFLNSLQAMDGCEDGALRVITRVVSGVPARNDRKRSRDRAAASDREFVMEISDTGPGFDEKEIDRVFDPFYTTKSTGSGLGLAIVHRILQEHHGRIEPVARPGEGAAFILSLPILEKPLSQEGAPFELFADRNR